MIHHLKKKIGIIFRRWELESNSRSTKDFSDRWNLLFYSFIRLRFEHVFLLRFFSQKSWTRRSKNVPILLKRNWIHNSMEDEEWVWLVCTLLFCVVHNAHLFSQGSLKVVSHEKSESSHRIFFWPRPFLLSFSLF